jgi:hypothetical protein
LCLHHLSASLNAFNRGCLFLRDIRRPANKDGGHEDKDAKYAILNDFHVNLS